MSTAKEIIAARFAARQDVDSSLMESTRYRAGKNGTPSDAFDAHWKHDGQQLGFDRDTEATDTAVVTVYKSDVASPEIDDYLIDADTVAWIIISIIEKNFIFTRCRVTRTDKILLGKTKRR